jgi:PilZ domain
MAINKKKSAQDFKPRAAKRCTMVASAEVTEIDSNTRLSARTSEIGIGGCYVDAMSPFPEGTVVQVRILRDQGVFEAKAKVVYCDSTMGMGLAFSEMAPEKRLLLEDWLAEIVKPAS